MLMIYKQNDNNTGFDYVCSAENFTSMQWKKRFIDIGSFEIHLAPNDINASMLNTNCFIHDTLSGNDGFVIKKYQTRGEIVLIGYDLCGIFAKRAYVTSRTSNYNVNRSSVLSSLIGNNASAFSSSAKSTHGGTIRTFSSSIGTGFTFTTNCTDTSQFTYDIDLYTNTTKQTDELIKEKCIEAELGYDVYFSFDSSNINLLVFNTIQAADKSESFVIDCDTDDVFDYKFTEEVSEEKNAVMHKNNSDKTYLFHTDTAYAEKGIYLNSTIASPSQMNLSFAETRKILAEENEGVDTVIIDAEINTVKYKYGIDFSLGDFITVKGTFFGNKVERISQITEVEQIFERNNVKVNVALGLKRDNAFRKLKRQKLI